MYCYIRYTSNYAIQELDTAKRIINVPHTHSVMMDRGCTVHIVSTRCTIHTMTGWWVENKAHPPDMMGSGCTTHTVMMATNCAAHILPLWLVEVKPTHYRDEQTTHYHDTSGLFNSHKDMTASGWKLKTLEWWQVDVQNTLSWWLWKRQLTHYIMAMECTTHTHYHGGYVMFNSQSDITAGGSKLLHTVMMASDNPQQTTTKAMRCKPHKLTMMASGWKTTYYKGG